MPLVLCCHLQKKCFTDKIHTLCSHPVKGSIPIFKPAFQWLPHSLRLLENLHYLFIFWLSWCDLIFYLPNIVNALSSPRISSGISIVHSCTEWHVAKWCLFNCLCGLEISCFFCEGKCDIVCNGFCEWPFQVAAGITHPIPLPAKGALGLFCYLSPGLHLEASSSTRVEKFKFLQNAMKS